jgi:hypothetical protein
MHHDSTEKRGGPVVGFLKGKRTICHGPALRQRKKRHRRNFWVRRYAVSTVEQDAAHGAGRQF